MVCSRRLLSRSLGIISIIVAMAVDFSYAAETKANIAAQFGKLPLYFEHNVGQTDASVRYLTRGPGYTLFFTPDEIVLFLQNQASLRMQFVGANKEPTLIGQEEQVCKSNYFIGNDPQKWHTNISNYAKVAYKNVYPGIDAVFYGNPQHLEYDLCVAPGGCPNDVRLRIENTKHLSIDAEGDLRILTKAEHEVRMQKPIVYQIINGEKVSIESSFLLLAQNEIGFSLGKYDTNKTVVIDPVIIYSTYLGGSAEDIGYGIAVDNSGSAYVVGSTSSTNFPLHSPVQGTYGGRRDAFLTKFNPTGTALVYSTYLGGSGSDDGFGIAVDNSGNAYVAGITFSVDFPITAGSFQTTLSGTSDAFVTKLTPSGTSLLYSTYLGGTSDDIGHGIAVDSSGSAYVTGGTSSTDFPTMNPLQPVLGGNLDAFVTKFNSSGSALVYSTYLGGSAFDEGNSIAIDTSGSAYVTGVTSSTDFPTMNPLQPASGGSDDAFVTKYNPTGSAYVYSTYLGGSDIDVGLGIAVDGSGSAYVTGQTLSTDFPTRNPLQPALGGNDDAFVTKYNPAGSAYVYSTYLGGSDFDEGNSIAIDTSGSAYVTGQTISTNFPTQNPLQPTLGGSDDAFVTKYNPTGSAYVYSTYLGGSDADVGLGIAVDSSGSAYITGQTSSTNFPTKNPLQPTNHGLGDAFVTKIALAIPPPVVLPPSKFIGIIKKSRFLNATECTLIARWKASPSSNVAFYRIFKDGKVVATIPATSPLVFRKICLEHCSASGFEIAAVNSTGLESVHIALEIKPEKQSK